jgi:hypothetical protein
MTPDLFPNSKPKRAKPIVAFGFVGRRNEFVLSLWIVDFRFTWGY